MKKMLKKENSPSRFWVRAVWLCKAKNAVLGCFIKSSWMSLTLRYKFKKSFFEQVKMHWSTNYNNKIVTLNVGFLIKTGKITHFTANLCKKFTITAIFFFVHNQGSIFFCLWLFFLDFFIIVINKKKSHLWFFKLETNFYSTCNLLILFLMSRWTIISNNLNTIHAIKRFYHEQNSFLILMLVIRMRKWLISFMWDQFYEVYPLNLELKMTFRCLFLQSLTGNFSKAIQVSHLILFHVRIFDHFIKLCILLFKKVIFKI